jgi:hypothetical protein
VVRLELPELGGGGGVGGGRWWMSAVEGRKQAGKGEEEWWWGICVCMKELGICVQELTIFRLRKI